MTSSEEVRVGQRHIVALSEAVPRKQHEEPACINWGSFERGLGLLQKECEVNIQ